MGGLRKFVDKIKPTFSEGGKLSFLASTFDAFETFLFVPNTTTSRGAHIRDCNDMKRTMIVVVVALMPALLFGMYNTGYQVGMTGWAAFIRPDLRSRRAFAAGFRERSPLRELRGPARPFCLLRPI